MRLEGAIHHLRANLLRVEFKLRKKTIGEISEKEERGSKFEKNILDYIHGLDEVEHNFGQRIPQLGARITEAVNDAPRFMNGGHAKCFRRDIWLDFMDALAVISRRPSKKVAAILLDKDNRMLAWDGNHVCHGVVPTAELFVKEKGTHRGTHLWCAERNLKAKHLQLAANVEYRSLGELHQELHQFELSLRGAVIGRHDLRDLTLGSSHFPCLICTDTVVAPKNPNGRGRIAAVAELIARYDHGLERYLRENPDRNTEMAKRHIRAAGIRQTVRYAS